MKPRTSGIWRFVAMGALVVSAAACQNETVAPNVTPLSVVVVPSSITLAAGQTGQFVATVTGGTQSTAKTVSWSSSNSSVATVDQTGKVTAVASGQATIIATSTADATVQGAGNVTVTGSTGPGVTAVTIASITKNNTTTPVNPQGTFGQIDVTLNLDAQPGDVSSVKVFVDSTEVCTQSVSASSSTGDAPQSTEALQTIVCSFNTAGLDDNGNPLFLNGPHSIVAKVYGPSGSEVATANQSLVFANANVTLVSMMMPDSAINPNTGLLWTDGDVTLVAHPALYSGGSVGRVTFNLKDGSSTIGTKTDQTPDDGFEVTFYADSATLANFQTTNLNAAVTTVTTAGATGPTGSAAGVQYDNMKPDSVNFSLSMKPYHWINDASLMTLVDTTQFQTTALSGAVDTGVDDVTYTFWAGASYDSLSQIESYGDLEDSSDTTAYVAVLKIMDSLGNTRTLQLRGDTLAAATDSAHFGIDTQAPTIEMLPATLDPQRAPNDTSYTTANTDVFHVEYQDVGASGFGTTTPVHVTVMRYDTASATPTCYVGSGSSCKPVADDGVTAVPPVTDNGYFVYSGYVVDKAGNKSNTVMIRVLNDDVAPEIVDFTAPALTSASGGTSVTFTAEGADNLDFASADAGLSYNAGWAVFSGGPTQTFGTYGQDTLTTDVTITNTFDNFIRAIAQTTAVGGANNDTPTTVWNYPDAMIYDIADVAGNTATSSQAFAYTPTPTATWAGVDWWELTAAEQSKIEATVQVDTLTTSATPFASVRFYVINGAGQLELLGTDSSPAISDITGGKRVFRYDIQPSGLTGDSGDMFTVVAIGVTSNGDALATIAGTVTIP